jgi:methionine synthase I (cobalamin-dependent)
MKNNMFLVNEGSDKLMIVMTYKAMMELQRMIKSVENQWSVNDDFAYVALTGDMIQKGETVDGKQENL